MDLENLQNSIIEAIDQEDCAKAMSYLKEYVDGYGFDTFYYMSLSDIFLILDRPLDVLELMNDAESDGVDRLLVCERKGDAYLSLDDYENALDSYKQCDIESDNLDNLQVHHMMGLCYFHLKDYKNAIEYFENVLLEESRYDSLAMCGISYYYVNKKTRSKEYIGKALTSVEGNDYVPIFKFLVNDVDYEYFEEISENYLKSNLERYYEAYTSYYMNHDNDQEALKSALKLYEVNESVYTSFRLATLYKRNGFIDEANKLFENIFNMSFNSESDILIQINYRLASMEEMNCDSSKVRTMISTWLSELDDDIECICACIHFCIRQGFYSVAKELLDMYEPFFLTDPQIAMMYDLRMEYYLNSKEYQEGLEYLESQDNFEKDRNYYHNLVVFNYYLENYERIIQVAMNAMPNGLIASMAHHAALLTNHFEFGIKIQDSIYQALNCQEDVVDLDVYLEFLDKINNFEDKD